MPIQVARFVDGVRVADRDPIGDQVARAAAGNGFVWIDVAGPADEDLPAIARAAGLSDTALAIVAADQPRPRLEHHGEQLAVVLRSAVYVDPDEAVEVGQLGLIVGRHVVLTVARAPLPERRQRPLDADLSPGKLALGPLGVFVAVASQVVRSYGAVLAGLDQDIEEIEAQVFSGDRGSYAERIYRLKGEVQLFRRAVGALPDELEELLDDAEAEAVGGPMVDVLVWLRGVRAEAMRVSEQIAGLDDLLNSALNAHLAQIGVRQNEDMRRISAWVAIAAVPTAIAAIYGMNFDHMPELGWRYAYFVVLGVMAAACLVLYRLFRRSGWL